MLDYSQMLKDNLILSLDVFNLSLLIEEMTYLY